MECNKPRILRKSLSGLLAVICLQAAGHASPRAQQDALAAVPGVRLYVSDCGTRRITDLGRFQLEREEVATSDLSVAKHAESTHVGIVPPGDQGVSGSRRRRGCGLRVLHLRGTIRHEGGVPIIVGGKLVGAVGVCGGSVEQDGQVANAGARALK